MYYVYKQREVTPIKNDMWSHLEWSILCVIYNLLVESSQGRINEFTFNPHVSNRAINTELVACLTQHWADVEVPG